MRASGWLLAAAVVASVGSAFPGDVPKAEVLLEGFTSTLPDQAAEGAPVRFVLLETGQVYVGGTSQIAEGRLASGERKALLSRVDAVRKLPALAGRIALGPGPERYRLLLQRGRPIDMTITGDPGQAIPALQPLASLMRDLLSFHHDSLRPFQPAQYALRAREGVLPGGCRRWTLPDSPAASAFAPRVVPASSAAGWPTGATPASVCDGDKRFVVTFRPLVPGESP